MPDTDLTPKPINDIEQPQRGIYYLYMGGKLVYISHAADAEGRVREHKRRGTKAFDSYAILPYDSDDITAQVAKDILTHKPKMNTVIPHNERYLSANQVKTIAGKYKSRLQTAMRESDVTAYPFGMVVYFDWLEIKPLLDRVVTLKKYVDSL